jgi:O-acetyl-ADP-ribose deacetylase
VWNGGTHGEEDLLASCYRRSLELCGKHQLSSVAFPAISTGIYRFPADRAADIAVRTTIEMLPGVPSVTRVVFCCFSEPSGGLHAEALSRHSGSCAE